MVTDWPRFVGEFGPLVFACAWRILGHAADAEDVTQDVFFEAYCLQQKQPVNHWPALLRRMATCRALDRLRHKRRIAATNNFPLLAGGNDPIAEAIAHELEERVRQEMARLPAREAEVFCLRYIERQPNDAIATMLGISASAVSTALHKARTRLNALLAADPNETSHER